MSTHRLEEDQRAGYCRQCGERLPLIKRVKREEFCSDEHRQSYLASTTDVALDRLLQTGSQAMAAVEAYHQAAYDETHLNGYSEPAVETAVLEPEPPQVEPEPDPEPQSPEPPLAGSILPGPVGRPWRLAIVLDSAYDGDEGLGGWQPVRPEPEWAHLALQFGLAEFSDATPDMAEEAMTLAGAEATSLDPGEGHDLTIVLPHQEHQLQADEAVAEAVDALDTPPFAPAVAVDSVRSGTTPAALAAAPPPEPSELDTVLYLPEHGATGGTPEERTEQMFAAWQACASAAELQPPSARPPAEAKAMCPEDMLCHLTPAHSALALPLTTGCAIERDHSAATLEMLLEAEAAPSDTPFDEHFLASAELSSAPAPLGEERGMSEAVQTVATDSTVGALGARVTLPFLHEPQPRAGSAAPRWLPATASLNTSAEAATEDWDIL